MSLILKNALIIYSAICVILASRLVDASLSISTTKTIQGDKPTFTPEIEENINNFVLFGLNYTDPDTLNTVSYYDNSDISNIGVRGSYPFYDLFSIAPIKQPTEDQYANIDGDLFKELIASSALTMQWFYTNVSGQEVLFTPSKSDTFCNLYSAGKEGPYKVKIFGDLVLRSHYGDPSENTYPNETVSTQPSITYTILNDPGICYAKPALTPSTALGVSASQWDAKSGFLIQSLNSPEKNFPSTGFYGAKFDLLLAKSGLAANYDWSITKGSELVNISVDSSGVHLVFNKIAASSTDLYWNYIMSTDGYEVVVEGIHRTKGYSIKYPFKLTKWFSGWSKANLDNATIGYRGDAKEIIQGCASLSGKYKISEASHVSNAPYNTASSGVSYTREVGTLLGEWGYLSQDNYPGSWGAKESQANSYSRIWLYDTNLGEYCDLHLYNSKYHCISEAGNKNGVCIATN
ncbi:hypothetical protein DES39_0415 [Orbus hercynius]|uniref:Uncharacterized protein n=1 Tax=Orbus hercynius TaxID=593135 RepID=A0A495RJ59_9GAMM|nr:hypothetical protein [Orbus hercynius]RKS87196.1 hypothetical protein DES39_0415 [Orbus hercynius]